MRGAWRAKAVWLLSVSALLALFALAGCGGGDDEESTSTEAAPAAQSDGSGAAGEAPGEPGRGDGGDPGQADGEPAPGQGGGDEEGRSASKVDLTVDPSSIKGARVTETGAVQTVEPDSADHEIAQENSYSSIKAFGEEAEGEEATNITFALVQYLNAKAEGDWATACARIYSVLRASLERDGADCVATFGALMSRSAKSNREEQAQIDVSSVRRGEGNRAFVIYKTPATLSADMPMYVEDGVWTVGALEAYVLTPEQLAAGQ